MRRQNAKLQNQVKELQRLQARQSFTREECDNLELDAQKDEIIQMINVQQKLASTDLERHGDRLEKINLVRHKLKQEISSFKNQLAQIDGKEKDLLKCYNTESFSRVDKEQERKELLHANNALRSDIHRSLAQKEKDSIEAETQFKSRQSTMANLQAAQMNYSLIAKERRRHLTYLHMHRSPQDVEEMIRALKNHFEIIKKATVQDYAVNDGSGNGVRNMIESSNRNLKKLREDLDQLKVSKEDLRYETYKMMVDVVKDNIELRLRLNEQIANQIKSGVKNIERHAKRQLQYEKEASGSSDSDSDSDSDSESDTSSEEESRMTHDSQVTGGKSTMR